MGDNQDAKALYVGNLHPYVNEAVLQVLSSPVFSPRTIALLA